MTPEEALERRRAYAREYYWRTREKRLESQRKYQAKPEYREYQRNYARTDKAREANRRWIAANREQHRAAVRRGNRKGWAPGEHEKAEARLPHVVCCDACESTNPGSKKGWAADHDHQTGLFRGFLCRVCNVCLGYVEKYGLGPNRHLAEYLARHVANTTT